MTMYHQVASWMQFFTLYQSARGDDDLSHTPFATKTRGVQSPKAVGLILGAGEPFCP